MSRSYKKTPISTICGCKSQKKGKVCCNKYFRRISKIKLLQDKDPLFYKNEALNQWELGGDGKIYWTNLDKNKLIKMLRK